MDCQPSADVAGRGLVFVEGCIQAGVIMLLPILNLNYTIQSPQHNDHDPSAPWGLSARTLLASLSRSSSSSYLCTDTGLYANFRVTWFCCG
jgi:hypothetical protein